MFNKANLSPTFVAPHVLFMPGSLHGFAFRMKPDKSTEVLTLLLTCIMGVLIFGAGGNLQAPMS
jgi:hypothetical protein